MKIHLNVLWKYILIENEQTKISGILLPLFNEQAHSLYLCGFPGGECVKKDR